MKFVSGASLINIREAIRSAALEWASEQRRELGSEQQPTSTEGRKKQKKFVVVGGGWAGWGAAKTLCQSSTDAHVILIDALPDPTGRTPYLSKTGKPIEAGTRGFWKVRENIKLRGIQRLLFQC